MRNGNKIIKILVLIQEISLEKKSDIRKYFEMMKKRI